MHRLIPMLCVLILASLPALGQAPDAKGKIIFDPKKDVDILNSYQGQDNVHIKIKFKVTLPPGKEDKAERDNFKIEIWEDDVLVKTMDVPPSREAKEMSIMLAVDASGGIRGNFEQVKTASSEFLKNLPGQANCGLLLFNHQVLPPELRPGRDREPLRKLIQKAQPRGGNACFDAAVKSIDILGDVKSKKAVVLVTNGLDLNSKATADDIIRRAKQHEVKVYTVGIGEKSSLEPVHSVLVLDHSGSMIQPADDKDKSQKIQGLHRAGAQFINMMPTTARTTLIPFGDTVELPDAFSNDQVSLIRKINGLKAEGETALFDAIFAGIETLEANNPDGKKRRVVAMTDGIDNKSRRRVDEVIARARASKIPLYLLGFGRKNEIDGETMDRMAKQTGGVYFHAANEQALVKFFEELSIKIHEDGIDEEKLRRIAHETGGEYFQAKNAKDLKFMLESVSNDIREESIVYTFPSLRKVPDGLPRNVDVKLVEFVGADKGKMMKKVVDEKRGGGQTHGVVIAEMNHVVYLGMLGILAGLIGLPAWLRRKAE